MSKSLPAEFVGVVEYNDLRDGQAVWGVPHLLPVDNPLVALSKRIGVRRFELVMHLEDDEWWQMADGSRSPAVANWGEAQLNVFCCIWHTLYGDDVPAERRMARVLPDGHHCGSVPDLDASPFAGAPMVLRPDAPLVVSLVDFNWNHDFELLAWLERASHQELASALDLLQASRLAMERYMQETTFWTARPCTNRWVAALWRVVRRSKRCAAAVGRAWSACTPV